jgi:hypothetical protein
MLALSRKHQSIHQPAHSRVVLAPAATNTFISHSFLGASTPWNYPCSIRYHFNGQPILVSDTNSTLTKQSTPTSPPGRARRPCASGGRALGWAIKNSWKTCGAAQKAVSIVQCPQIILEETLQLKVFFRRISFQGIALYPTLHSFPLFFSAREDSIART